METKLIATVVSVILAPFSIAGADSQTISNDREHYRVSLPQNWTVWGIGPSGVLSATSYPKTRALEGGLVPSGEAAINIFPHKGTTTTINEWIAEAVKYVEEVHRTKVTLDTRHGDVSSYIEVEARYDSGPDVFYRRVTAFYVLKDRIFAAQLEFKEGDSSEAKYRGILNEVIRSIVSI